MNLSISRVQWKQAEPLLKNIREKVFVCEWRIPKKVEFDRKDKSAFHMIVCDDATQEPVATGRIMPNGEISRICVLPSYRKHKIDKMVLRGLLKVAADIGLNKVYINSPLEKVEHYQENNFDVAGSVYMEAGIARQKMACEVDKVADVKCYLSH